MPQRPPATFAWRPLADDPAAAIVANLEELGITSMAGQAAFVKPNFTYAFEQPGITTTRRFLESTVSALKDLGCRRIVIGEGDGGYNSFDMRETFRAFGLDELERRYGVEAVLLSDWPSHLLHFDTRKERFEVPVPSPLLEEFDRFVTLPVPKVHAMTTMSGALKNQWGLVQGPLRLRFHVHFDEVITRINQLLPDPLVLVDGTHGLTGNGPMLDGEPIDLGWTLAARDPWLADRILTRVMGLDEQEVKPLGFALRSGLVPPLPADADLPPADPRFRLELNRWNRLAKLTWRSARLNHLVYFSGAAGALHRVMYAFRSRPPEVKVKGVDW